MAHFVLDDGRTRTPPRFTQVNFGGLSFRYCPSLKVSTTDDRLGHQWLVVGDPINTRSGRAGVEDVAERSGDSIEGVVSRWNGRFCLIGAGSLQTDYFGTTPVYYSGRAVSSSLALLCPEGQPASTVTFDQRLNWYPPPSTSVDGVLRLLPSQSLRIHDLTPLPRPLLRRRPGPRSYATSLQVLRSRLTSVLAHAPDGRLLLPLTGGHDSRLLLALCRALDLDVTCFTQLHYRMSDADRALPATLAAMCDYEHQVVGPRRLGSDRGALARYDLQVSGTVRDADRLFLARHQFDLVRRSDVLVRGVGFELGRRFYRSLPEHPTSEGLIRAFAPSDPIRMDGLRAWHDWAVAHPEDMDWRDRFYWEQRMGGWLGPIEAGLDLLPARRLNPALSQDVASLLLELPVEVRDASTHHVDLIEMLVPALAALPFNPPDRRWSRGAWVRKGALVRRRVPQRLRAMVRRHV